MISREDTRVASERRGKTCSFVLPPVFFAARFAAKTDGNFLFLAFCVEKKNTPKRHLPTFLFHSFNHKGNIRLKYKHSSVVAFVTTV